MAKKIKQFRYYNDENTLNCPSGLTAKQLEKGGTAFEKISRITQLGIQSLPGTAFYLNNSDTEIIIGSTGIYELDIDGISEIDSLYFAEASVGKVADNDGAYLIIDMICEEDS